YSGYLATKRAPAYAGERPLVVCTTGGGVDGAPLISAFVEASRELRAQHGGRWLAVTGPLLADDEHEALVAAARPGGAEVVRSVPDLPALLAGPDAVVA